MTMTLARLYDNPRDAHRVVMDLEAAGIASRDISIVSNAKQPPDRDGDDVDDRAEGAVTGASIGATVGGAAGLLAGLGLLAIPGLGPVVAAGWLAATAAAAVAGGAAGGIIGALTQAGVSKSDADVYAEGVRRGGTLIAARVPDGDRARVEAILDQAAINIREREQNWRDTGWAGFDPSAKPYSADQIRTEREIYRERTTR